VGLTPYKHQLECVDKLGRPEISARLIADDMGLGKTLEALWVDDELRSERHAPNGNRKLHPCYKRPTLIVAPKSTHRDAWFKAIRQIRSGDYWSDYDINRSVAIIDPKDRGKLSARLKLDPLPMYVIVHYEALRLMPELKDIKWFHVIGDEIHRVKNRKSQQANALKALQSFYKTGLSGTPADDKPQDIWSVLNWLYPKVYTSYWKFINTYCTQETGEVRSQGRTFKKITGVNKEKIPQLHGQWSSWYIRRTKDEVLDDLPPKTYTEMFVDLLPGQRRAYEQMRKDMIAWVGEHQDQPLVATIAIAQLTRLQQFALASVSFGDKGKVTLVDPSSKLDRLIEIVDGNPNESLVVFTQSRSMVDLVVRRLKSHDVTAVPYHGRIPDRERDRNVQAFQGGHAQVFAGTIAAGGEGITLHRASNVVFLDRMWNPTKNRQAEDRLHRIGQQRPVQVIDIMASNTVDQGKNQRIVNKWNELLYLLGDTKTILRDHAMHDALAIFMGE